MPVCSICKKEQTASREVRVAPCRSCGYDPNSPATSVAAVIKKLQRTSFAHRINSNPIAGQILSCASDKDRVQRTLGIVLFMNDNASIIHNLVAVAPRAERVKRVEKADHELRTMAGGYQVLGHANYPSFARDPQRLRDQCTQGWASVRQKWSVLAPRYREHFVAAAFEHEKGYPETVQSVVNYVQPDHLTMEAALTHVFTNEVKEDFFTGRHDGRTMSNGERIRTGFALAKNDPEKLNFMWFQILFLTGKEFAEQELPGILGKIRQNRAVFIQALSDYLPRKEVMDFLDAKVQCDDGRVRSLAEKVWGEVMGF